MSEDEALNYINTSNDVDFLLTKAIAYLRRRHPTASPQEQLDIEAQIPLMEGKQANIRADKTAFNAETLAINPPTKPQIDTIRKHSTDLDTMITNSQNANSILVLVTAAANEWNNTRSA